MGWPIIKKSKNTDSVEPLAHKEEIEAVREETNQALKEFNEKFNKLNQVLEQKGDTAYNIFMATPASRNYRKKTK